MAVVVSTARPPGTLLNCRYRVLSVIDREIAGSVYLVQDRTITERIFVAKEVLIPKFHMELPGQLERLSVAVEGLRQLEDPALVRIVDFFSESGRAYVISDVAGGFSLQEGLDTGGAPIDAFSVLDIALQLARALQKLVEAGQAQAIKTLSPRHIMLTPHGDLTVINYGLGQYLRPAVESTETKRYVTTESLAVERWGEIVYALMTGKPWKGEGIPDGQMTEGLGRVIRRVLTPRQRSPQTFESLFLDLRMLHLIREQSGLDLEESMPVEEETTETNARNLIGALILQIQLQPGSWKLMEGLGLCAIAALIFLDMAAWGGGYVKDGPIVYLACENGDIQVWSVEHRRRLVTLHPGVRTLGLAYTSETKRTSLNLEDGRLMSLDSSNNAMAQTGSRQACGGRLVGDGASVWCLNDRADIITRFDTQKSTSTQVVAAGRIPSDVSVAPRLERLLIAVDNPAEVRALSSKSGILELSTSLSASPGRSRLSPDGSHLWVLHPADNSISILDSSTLLLQAHVHCRGRNPVDLFFSDSGARAYVLCRDSGTLERLSAKTGELEGSVPVGRDSVSIVRISGREFWVLNGGGRNVAVLDPDSDVVQQMLPLGATPHAGLWIP